MLDHNQTIPEAKPSDPDPSPRGETIDRADWPHMFPGQLRKLADLLEMWRDREPDGRDLDSFYGCLALMAQDLAGEARRRADDRDLRIKGTAVQIQLRADEGERLRGEFVEWLADEGGRLVLTYREICDALAFEPGPKWVRAALDPILDRSQYSEWERGDLSDEVRDAYGIRPHPEKPVWVFKGDGDRLGPNEYVLKGSAR